MHLLSPVQLKQASFPSPLLPCLLPISGPTAGLLQGFGVGAAAVGTTISVYALARLMMNLPAGMLADSHGRKPLLVWGPAITALGELLTVRDGCSQRCRVHCSCWCGGPPTTCVSCSCMGAHAATRRRWQALCSSALQCCPVCGPATTALKSCLCLLRGLLLLAGP